MRVLIAAALGLLATVSPIAAQTPPSASEIAAYTGLHAAVATGELAAIRAVLATKPDLEARDGHGRTAAHVAAHRARSDVLELLAAAGADLNALDSRRYDVVTILAVADKPAVLETAIRLGAKATNITSPYDGTALIAAAHLGNHEVVGILIRAGAPLNHVNNLGWTALMEAIVLGDGGLRHQRSLKALLDAKADRTIPDRQGVTPLTHAERMGYVAMVQMLKGP
jgi:ankyrin repeat protein